MNILIVCSCECSILKTGQSRQSRSFSPPVNQKLTTHPKCFMCCGSNAFWSTGATTIRHVLLLYSSPTVHVTITFCGRITLISKNVDDHSSKRTKHTQGSHHVHENALLKVSVSPAYYFQSTAVSEERLDSSSSQFGMNALACFFKLFPIIQLQAYSESLHLVHQTTAVKLISLMHNFNII